MFRAMRKLIDLLEEILPEHPRMGVYQLASTGTTPFHITYPKKIRGEAWERTDKPLWEGATNTIIVFLSCYFEAHFGNNWFSKNG